MKKRSHVQDNLWAGTVAALDEYLELEAMAAAKIAAGWSTNDVTAPEEDQAPYLFSQQGNVGVITINGSITNKDAWYNEYLGIASYNAIREAMIYAASDESVGSILLSINSGGGTVSGVSDCGDLIRMINDKVKPVTAFTDGNMCSAAYWLGCSAGEVFASNVSTVGSIGVIATHMEYSKQLEQDGVTPTVFRGGKYKALMNSVEPLTAAAKEQFQSQIDAAERVFVSFVADMVGKSYDYTYTNMAQGKEFFGEQALAAGLVDGISNYDKVVSQMQAIHDAKSLDTNPPFSNTLRSNIQGADMNKKKALTEVDIAAIAAGAPALAAAVTTEVKTPEQLAAEAEAVIAAAAVTSTETEKPAAPAVDASVVTFLQTQVKDKDAAILAANIELNGLKAKLAENEAAHADLLTIAGNSLNNMRIALGGSAIDNSGVSALSVLAEHKKLQEQFVSKFKAGGIAAVDAAAAENEEAQNIDPMMKRRLAAVRPTASQAK